MRQHHSGVGTVELCHLVELAVLEEFTERLYSFADQACNASSSLAFPLYSANRDVATSSERDTLWGIGNGHSRLHIRVVIGGDPPFASVLHHDLQQACTEASLVIGIRPRKQLLNSGH
jgi:hypothetical protein